MFEVRGIVAPVRPCVAFMLLMCALAGPGIAAAYAQDRQIAVLALYTTRRGAPAAAMLDATIERVLGQSLDGRLDYYSEHIDLARFPEPSHEAALRDFLRSRYRPQQFDLIIATTNGSLDFVRRHGSDLFPGTPVVFSSGPGAEGMPNATGVISDLDFRTTLDIALEIQPDTQQVFVISGASEFDRYYAVMAREQFEEFEARLAFTYLSGLAIPELLTRVASLPAHSIIYYLSVLEDGAGHRFVGVDSLDEVTGVANAPVYAWHTIGMGHGLVGGSLLSSELLGRRIGELALQVLSGEPPDAIPPTEFDATVVEFDWRQLRRWQINEARLPAGSTVHYRQRSAWEQYRVYIIVGGAALLLQTSLITALLVGRARRRRIEGTLRQNQQRYALATSAGAVGVWDWNLETNETYVDPQLKLILGYQDGEIRSQLDDWAQRVHPDDRDAVMAGTRACLDGPSNDYQMEHRMLHRDGSVRWFLARGSVLRRPDGAAYRLVGTDTDITERKYAQTALQENEAALREYNAEVQNLAGRLIAAQEEERTRIARDLHDDVSQQLAVLSIALSSLRRRTGALEAGDDLQGGLTSLQQRIIALAENIRGLSHDLHPSMLQHGGLVAALGAHCAEVERVQGFRVSFQADDDLAALSPEATLCLFRVAQEALHNTASHAEASCADVRLSRIGSDAELTVADDGKGFDIRRAGRNRSGLGLLSINERVRLVRGTVSIVTELTKGTRLQVRIPVDRQAPDPHAAETREPDGAPA